MHLTDLRWWHWAIIGLLLGALGGSIRSFYADIPDEGVSETMSQKDFERNLLRKNSDKEYPFFSSLKVVPFEDRQIIIGTYNVRSPRPRPAPGSKEAKEPPSYEPRMIRVVPDLPYKPTSRFKGDFPKDMTPAGFLDWVSDKHPNLKVSYTYLWWTTARAQFGVWMVGGLLLMGFVWPTTINLMLFRRPWRPKQPKEPDYDLDRFTGEKTETTPAASAQNTADNAAALQTSLQEIEAQLAASGQSRPESVTEGETTGTHAATTVRKLDAGPLEAAKAPEPEEKKDYAGQFYPTVAHAPKHKDGT